MCQIMFQTTFYRSLQHSFHQCHQCHQCHQQVGRNHPLCLNRNHSPAFLAAAPIHFTKIDFTSWAMASHTAVRTAAIVFTIFSETIPAFVACVSNSSTSCWACRNKIHTIAHKTFWKLTDVAYVAAKREWCTFRNGVSAIEYCATWMRLVTVEIKASFWMWSKRNVLFDCPLNVKITYLFSTHQIHNFCSPPVMRIDAFSTMDNGFDWPPTNYFNRNRCALKRIFNLGHSSISFWAFIETLC